MGFREVLEHETVGELPLREAIEVRSGTVLRAAVAVMRSRSLGCAVLVDSSGVPSGIFTEHSLMNALMQDASLDDRPVIEFADPKFLSVTLSEPIAHVWDAIHGDGLRFVCVTDDNGKLIGITGQRGISEYISECFPQQVAVQRLGSTPWMQQREGA